MKERTRYLLLFVICVLTAALSALSFLLLSRLVFLLCAASLFSLLWMYYYFVIAQPAAARRKYLDAVIRNREWGNFRESRYWKNMPESRELETIIDALVKEARDQDAAEDYERRAALQQLTSQINPHFLYNTLESIRGEAVMDGNTEIAGMLETLGDFFRYSISRKDPVVTLREELNNIKNYMKIQNYRFQDRFALEIELEDESLLENYIPKLILQPIIENSMIHAFQNRKTGKITILAEASEQLLIMTVSDDGEGMDRETLQMMNNRIQGMEPEETAAGGKQYSGNHVALPNIDRRIKLLFGDSYGLTMYSTAGRGTDTEIVMPRIINREQSA